METPNVHVIPNSIATVAASVHTTVRWAYKAKIVDGTARDVYELLLSTSAGRCPNCLVRDSQQLDHYLPKETYPGLSLHPANLVPICSWCNHRKGAQVATDQDDQFLHPYFDDLGPDSWLAAVTLEEPLAPLRYYVEPHAGWTENLTRRVIKHFDRYKLADLYAAEAATLLASISHRLSKARPSDRRSLLLEDAESYRLGGMQPWLAAAFSAWADSVWFCNGGWLRD